MIPRLNTTHLVAPHQIPPSREGFEVVGTFNPAACPAPTPQHPQRVALIIRVAERPLEQRPGYFASPRYTRDGNITTDWIPLDRVNVDDPRKAVFHDTGFKRLAFTSHLRVAFTHTSQQLDELGPRIQPFHQQQPDPLATFGYEDPRLTPITLDGQPTFLLTVVGASEHGVVTRLLQTDNFQTFQPLGPLESCAFCRENKDITLFPETIDGQYLAIHRPTGQFAVSPPSMWIARSPDLLHFGQHQPLYAATHDAHFQLPRRWDNQRIGGGAPPLRTEHGWLVLYHAATPPQPNKPAGTYAGGALLLDLEQPSRVISALPAPFITPEKDFETQGFVNAVVFPTGIVQQQDQLDVYYGAADTHVGRARFSFTQCMDRLQQHRT